MERLVLRSPDRAWCFRQPCWLGTPQPDFRRVMPMGGAGNGRGQRVDQRWLRLHPWPQKQGLDLEYALASMRLGVQSTDQPAAMKYRQHEVPILSACCRGIALDGV